MSFITEKISIFEKGAEKDINLQDKLATMSITDKLDSKNKEPSILNNTNRSQTLPKDEIEMNLDSVDIEESTKLLRQQSPEKLYKTNINKFNFLQTQLMGNTEDIKEICDSANVNTSPKEEDVSFDNEKPAADTVFEEKSDAIGTVHKSDSNITDDIRLASSQTNTTAQIDYPPLSTSESSIIEPQIAISVPPRKKKNLAQSGKSESDNKANDKQKVDAKSYQKSKVDAKFYPDHLNPFSDDEVCALMEIYKCLWVNRLTNISYYFRTMLLRRLQNMSAPIHLVAVTRRMTTYLRFSHLQKYHQSTPPRLCT